MVISEEIMWWSCYFFQSCICQYARNNIIGDCGLTVEQQRERLRKTIQSV